MKNSRWSIGSQKSFQLNLQDQEYFSAFVNGWVDTAERFISAVHRAIMAQNGPHNTGRISLLIPAGVPEAIRDDVQVPPEWFPGGRNGPHWILLANILCHAEQGQRPTIQAMLEVFENIHEPLPIGGGDPYAELAAVLEREPCSIGMSALAGMLEDYKKRADEIALAWELLKKNLPDTRRTRPQREPPGVAYCAGMVNNGNKAAKAKHEPSNRFARLRERLSHG